MAELDPKLWAAYAAASLPTGWVRATPAPGNIGDYSKIGNGLSIEVTESAATEDTGTLDTGNHVVPRQTLHSGGLTLNHQYETGSGDAGYLIVKTAFDSGAVLYLLISNQQTGDLEQYTTGIVVGITRSVNRTAGAVVGTLTFEFDDDLLESAVP